MPIQRQLLLHCPEAYDEVRFLSGGPNGQAQVTAPQPNQHDWEQRMELVQYDFGDDRSMQVLLGPVGERCRRCLSRISPTGDLTYTDAEEVERQKSGAAPKPQLLVPR